MVRRMKRALRIIGQAMLVLVFSALWSCPIWLGACSRNNVPIQDSNCECNCPGYVKKELIEYQYEQLIRPLVVEAVGFQGIVLRDSIGTMFVITDDKALHEVLQYSYNVGDTIK